MGARRDDEPLFFVSLFLSYLRTVIIAQNSKSLMFDLFQLFLLNAEAGAYIKSYSALPILVFEDARKKGWSDDPRDAGGATMCGITLNTLRAWCAKHKLPVPTKDILRNISYANWRDVVKEFFWGLCRADEIKAPQLKFIIVDWVWASGPSVIKIVQSIVGANPDGIVGSKTIAAINAHNPHDLFTALMERRIKFIDACIARRPVNKVFRKGWIARLNRILPNPPYLSFCQSSQPDDYNF